MAPNPKDVYVKAFSGLRMGLPIYEPSVDSQLGDVGFIDENEGLFHKLYNVAKPPVYVFDGCPPALELVASKARYERLEAIHLKLNTTRGVASHVNVPLASAGNAVKTGYKFTKVRGRECILVPGKFIVKESLEEIGALSEYMTNHHKWIEKTYAASHGFKLKQLILVVGTVKTNSWAIAVTSENEIVEDLSFTISSPVGAKLWGEWSQKLSVSRSGPYMHNNKENISINQTLFIRRIALRPDIPLGKKGWVPTRAPPTFIQRLRATLHPDDDI